MNNKKISYLQIIILSIIVLLVAFVLAFVIINGNKLSTWPDMPLFANNIDECTDTSKQYVLPDGYLYEYVHLYTYNCKNQIPVSTDTDGSVYNGTGYKKNTRLDSHGNVVDLTSSSVQVFTTGFIPVKYGDIIRLENCWIDANATFEKYGLTHRDGAIPPYGNEKNKIGNSSTFWGTYKKDASSGVKDVVVDKDGKTIQFTWNLYSTTEYIRLTLAGNPENAVVTVNEEIPEPVADGFGWQQIKKYIPADWIKEIDETVSTVNKLNMGPDSVQFLAVTDIHTEPSDSNYNYVKNIGKVSATVMHQLDIPFIMNLGDSTTQSSGYDESIYKSNMEKTLSGVLSPIPLEKILLTVGNHDGATGNKDVDGEKLYYRYQLSNEERADIFFGWQKETNPNKKFGPGDTYYYIDDASTKTRYIMLNSFWSQHKADKDGFVSDVQYSFFHNPMFGQEQLDWFANDALDMPKGYSGIIGTHSANASRSAKDIELLSGIISAYKNKTTYSAHFSGEYDWQSSEISVDYTSAEGELIAIFAGHDHIDYTINGFAIPIINITTAGADVRDEDVPERIPGTANETAIDCVTIDKDARKIYMTRLGAGKDRVINY